MWSDQSELSRPLHVKLRKVGRWRNGPESAWTQRTLQRACERKHQPERKTRFSDVRSTPVEFNDIIHFLAWLQQPACEKMSDFSSSMLPFWKGQRLVRHGATVMCGMLLAVVATRKYKKLIVAALGDVIHSFWWSTSNNKPGLVGQKAWRGYFSFSSPPPASPWNSLLTCDWPAALMRSHKCPEELLWWSAQLVMSKAPQNPKRFISTP